MLRGWRRGRHILDGATSLHQKEGKIMNLTNNKYGANLNEQDFLCESLRAKKLFRSLNENFENMEHLKSLN